MKKKIVVCIGTFILTVFVLWGLLIASASIDNEAIKVNMSKSANTFKKKEPFQYTDGSKLNSIEDNYADAILLGVTWNMGCGNTPVKSSLDTKYYDGKEYGVNVGLYLTVKGDVKANVDYSRYWHGTAVLLRPLHMLTDIDGIKAISMVMIVLLSGFLVLLLYIRKCMPIALGFVVSIMLVQVWNVGLSLEYIPMFILMLIMSIWALVVEKKGDIYLLALAVASGTMTAFFDFLTTETLTILMPMLLVLAVREVRGRKASRKQYISFIAVGVIAWGLSYVMTFITKWGLATIATGENKFKMAFTTAERRILMGEEGLSSLEMFLLSVPANLSTMFGGNVRVDWGKIVVGIFIIALVAGSVFYLFRRSNDAKEINIVLLAIGVMPYVRYLALSNHSYLHEYFTYRVQCVTIMALWCMVWFGIRRSGRK